MGEARLKAKEDNWMPSGGVNSLRKEAENREKSGKQQKQEVIRPHYSNSVRFPFPFYLP